MLVEPLIYTNIFGEKIVTSSGEIFDLEINNSWNFITPTFYHKDTIANFLSIQKNNNISNDKYFIIHTDSFGIPQLRKLKLDKNLVDQINLKGLNIFLTETLTKYKDSYIKLDRIDLLNLDSFDLKKFNFDYNNQDVSCISLDDIEIFIKNNNLINVNVFIIEKDYKNIFQKYKNVSINYYDSFLIDHVSRLTPKKQHKDIRLTYKFLSTNFRYSPHRHLIASFLINKNSKISWAFEGNIDYIKNLIPFNLSDSKYYIEVKKGVDKLNNLVPLSIDIEYLKQKTSGDISDLFLLPSNDQIFEYSNLEYYNDVFCSVVSECNFFECTANFSEKTLAAIHNRRPFVILGSPETLRLLKDMGFKTFDKYWSEDYDKFYDSRNRFDAVCNTINSIDAMSLDECSNILLDMQNILEHNYQNLFKLTDVLKHTS